MWGGWKTWLAWALCVGCTTADAAPREPAAFVAPFLPERPRATPSEPLEPLPLSLDLDPDKVALGAKLFIDPRMSGDDTVTCAHCHSLSKGGANGEVHASLPGRKVGGINVPTALNSAFDFRYAWNGRFETLEAQLDFAMTSPGAMASTWDGAFARVTKDPALGQAIARSYPGWVGGEAVRDALVTYCRSLITPNSRFDRYLRGELKLAANEQRGYAAFRDFGCITCHQGINVGGNMFQRFGVMRDYFADRGGLREPDLGLYAATHDEADRFVFRVPSLRNVALTAPYFHDGSVTTLEEAARTMARYQLGRELGDGDANDIAAFLRALTGELHGVPL